MFLNKVFFKIMLPLVIIMVIVVAIPTAITTNDMTNLVMNQQQSNMQQASFFVKREMNNWFQDNQKELKNLSKLSAVTVSLGKSFMAKMALKKALGTFKKTLEVNKNFKTLILSTEKGEVKVATDQALVGTNISGEQFFSSTALIADTKVEGNYLSFYLKFPVESKGTKGVLIAHLSLENIVTEFFSKVKIGKTGYIAITNEEGVLLHHPDPKLILKMNLATSFDWGRQLVEKAEGFFRYDWRGDDKFLSFTRMDNTNWTISLTGYTSEFFQELNDSILFSTIITSIILIVSIVVLFFIIRLSTTAIGKLTDFIKNVTSSNDFSLSAEVKSGDEVGQAGDALNSLVTSVQISVKSISHVMSSLAKGDLTERIEEDLIGDLLILKTDTNSSLDLLKDLINEVNIGSNQMLSGSEQISDSSQALAQGASEQAASLEQTSSSLAEINAQAKKNAKDSEQAAKLAGETARLADEGNQQMDRLESSITGIQDASNEVSKIMKVIDEIAFQTNLLSLNAAVEAARAGKYGKGFAVVAEEVRNLANRSGEAAKNTAELIENSIKEVTVGVAGTSTPASRNVCGFANTQTKSHSEKQLHGEKGWS
ncbi:MAG: HAMP domain-containing protein [Deltaproteobacteria bacterium]|nr:HAMP domain-containing protein [Deltaproteobacteria bacterium]MBT6613330.1 HAMP domain-containing protein [Deltaproteobacteria bacterium]